MSEEMKDGDLNIRGATGMKELDINEMLVAHMLNLSQLVMDATDLNLEPKESETRQSNVKKLLFDLSLAVAKFYEELPE